MGSINTTSDAGSMKTQLAIWARYFSARAINDRAAELYLLRIEKILSTGSPVILELEHLSKLMGVDYMALVHMVNSPGSFYRQFSIPKKRGGERIIMAPYPSLLMCQGWIYKNILRARDFGGLAFAYVPGRSIVDNASLHLGCKALLKVDLKDFFPSIKIGWVINLFKDYGYSSRVAFYLAALCCCDGGLVQGAPTSPAISNLLLKGLDVRLSRLADCYGLKYSRYADDLSFSGGYIPHAFSEIVSSIVRDYGLNVNEGKTTLKVGGAKKIVTGLSVVGDRLRLPKSKRRELRKEYFYIRKYGYVSHMSKKKIGRPFYLDSLLGSFGFWCYVEPGDEFAREAFRYLSGLVNG